MLKLVGLWNVQLLCCAVYGVEPLSLWEIKPVYLGLCCIPLLCYMDYERDTIIGHTLFLNILHFIFHRYISYMDLIL